MEIQGRVDPSFEKVLEVFEAESHDVGDGGAAFAAYVEGRKVVDIWGGMARDGSPWQEDTTAILMSATKGMVALSAHILYDRGELDLEAPVARYWPEFAQNGKAAVTVRQVLSHTSGCVGIPGHERQLQWDGTGWGDTTRIAQWVAESPLAWEPGSKHGYHALTFGWIVGELIRRIDGRSLGTFFKQEVAEPLSLDLRIGTPPAEQSKVATVVQSPAEERAKALPQLIEALPEETREAVVAMMQSARDPASPSGQALVARDGESILDRLDVWMNNPKTQAAEIGSSNGTGSARSLARMYGMLSMGGTLDGVTLVSPESVRIFSVRQVEGPDAVLGMHSCWAIGYMGNWGYPGTPKRFGPSDDAFGHAGAGGQLGFAELDRKLGVGFVRSHLSMMPVLSARLTEALFSCL